MPELNERVLHLWQFTVVVAWAKSIGEESMAKAELVPLTVLRGLAAAYVVLYHFSSGGGPWIIRHGYLAVDLFFMLSGFVLAYVYWDEFSSERANVAKATKDFWIRRIARVYPLHTALILLLLGNAAIGAHTGARADHAPYVFAANLLLIQTPTQQPAYIGAAWSTSVEVVAYALFPLFLLIGRHRRGLSFAAALLLMLAVAIWLITQSPAGTLDVPAPALQAIARGLSEFVVGMFAYAFVYKRIEHAGVPDTGVVAVIVAIAIALMLPTSDIAVIALFPLLIVAAAANRGRAAAILSIGALTWLGTISYSIYLLHQPLLNSYKRLRDLVWPGGVGNGVAMAMADVAVIVVLLVAAMATYLTIERPARQLIVKWLATETPGPLAVRKQA